MIGTERNWMTEITLRFRHALQSVDDGAPLSDSTRIPFLSFPSLLAGRVIFQLFLVSGPPPTLLEAERIWIEKLKHILELYFISLLFVSRNYFHNVVDNFLDKQLLSIKKITKSYLLKKITRKFSEIKSNIKQYIHK